MEEGRVGILKDLPPGSVTPKAVNYPVGKPLEVIFLIKGGFTLLLMGAFG